MEADRRSSAPEFTLIAHRGDSAGAPENTMAAFDLALAGGIDNIELDVQLSADGLPMVIHDSTVDRTTDGSGAVSSMRSDTLRRLDAGSWKGQRFEGERIPTLNQVLEKYEAVSRLHLELKSREQELPRVVAETLLARGVSYRAAAPYEVPGVTITSFHVEQLHRSRQYLPDLSHGWLLDSITNTDLGLAVQLGLRGIYPCADRVTLESVQAAAKAGLAVRCWGIADSDDSLRRAYESGASGTTVDWPGRARLLIARMC